MKLSDDKINSIAQDVDMGMDVYLHKETGNTITIPNEINLGYGDTELWEDDLREVEDNRDAYLLIQDMPSREAYCVMEDFVSRIEDETTHIVLDVVLNNSKPFRNFKNTLSRFPELREAWFKYKQERLNQWVIHQIEADNFTT